MGNLFSAPRNDVDDKTNRRALRAVSWLQLALTVSSIAAATVYYRRNENQRLRLALQELEDLEQSRRLLRRRGATNKDLMRLNKRGRHPDL